jgi:hypothetical protein
MSLAGLVRAGTGGKRSRRGVGAADCGGGGGDEEDDGCEDRVELGEGEDFGSGGLVFFLNGLGGLVGHFELLMLCVWWFLMDWLALGFEFLSERIVGVVVMLGK